MAQGKLFKGSRIFAWVAAFSAILIVVGAYGTMPDTLPITRWSSAPRTPWLAFRVPTINVLSLVLVEVFVGALIRYSQSRDARAIAIGLFLTVGLKSLIEGLELYLLPWTSPLIPVALISVIVVGLGIVMEKGIRIFKGSGYAKIRFSSAQKWVAMVSAGAILVLQLMAFFQ